MKVFAELPGQDRIEGDKSADGKWAIQAIGCQNFLKAIRQLSQSEKNPENWTLPTGQDHSSMLLREFILKTRGQWNFPYKDAETCHCRMVPTAVVDQAILNGAHTTQRVSRETSASTACGTCRPDVQSMINYRLATT